MNDFKANITIYKDIIPPACINAIEDQQLFIIWDGEYINHSTGKKRHYIRGYQKKGEQANEKIKEGTKESSTTAFPTWEETLRKADSVWEKQAEEERKLIEKQRNKQNR
jgi:hypothetical protein